MPARARFPSMRKGPLLALAACHAVAQVAIAATAAEIFRVDPAATRAEFAVDHFWLATLHGSFARTHGTIVLDSRARSGSIDLVVDADSVDTGWSVRDDFIRGQHMFDASRFPEVRFRSRQLAFDGNRLGRGNGRAHAARRHPAGRGTGRAHGLSRRGSSGGALRRGGGLVDSALGLRHGLRAAVRGRRGCPVVPVERAPRLAVAGAATTKRQRRAGYRGRRPRSRSVAATSSRAMPGSRAEWPASGTTTYSASGQARCRSSALRIGQTMS